MLQWYDPVELLHPKWSVGMHKSKTAEEEWTVLVPKPTAVLILRLNALEDLVRRLHWHSPVIGSHQHLDVLMLLKVNKCAGDELYSGIARGKHTNLKGDWSAKKAVKDVISGCSYANIPLHI